MRVHLENAWKVATMNVHQAMEKMNQDFTAVATKERQKNIHLKQSVGQLEAKFRASEDYFGSFKSATQELESLRKDYGELEDDNVTQRRKNAELRRRIEELEGTNAGLVKEIAQVQEENHSLKDGLQTAARMMSGHKSEFAKLHSEKVERRASGNIPKDNELRKDDEGMDVMDYMSTVLSAVTDKVSRQMESRMNTVLSEIQEQRTLRMAAEQRSMEVLMQLQEVCRLRRYCRPFSF
jgi:septation ring formation regulator EzrA